HPTDPHTFPTRRSSDLITRSVGTNADSVGFYTDTSSRPCWRVFQDRVAHLMRTGNLTTPWSASRSPIFTSGSGALASVSLPSPSDRKSTRLNSSHLVIS